MEEKKLYFQEEYLKWLIKKMDGDDYRKLFNAMICREFTYFISNDDNRAADGINLRDIFFDETGIEVKDGIPCSILEMLVALSIRCEIDIVGVPGEEKISRLFWIMIKNLDLDWCTDARFDPRFVKEKMDILVERRYGRNGFGGLFPLYEHAKEDMRKTEIWYQMNYYICENAPVFDEEDF